MTATAIHHSIQRAVTRSPRVATAIYTGLILACMAIVALVLLDLTHDYAALSAIGEQVAEFQRRARGSASESLSAPESGDSPLLQGHSVTLAGATLLQLTTGAIARVRGTVISSEVDPQNGSSPGAYIKVTITCDIEQEALQQLLYDIEAGIPFLFVDRLDVQAPVPGTDNRRLRVLLGVSGLWRGLT
jgi:general secretion pathway protein M